MRVVIGQFSGTHISFPELKGARPTTSMVHEALFNKLSHQMDFQNLKVLELYSGTGMFSLECLSGGAAEATLVDTNTAALNASSAVAKKWNMGEKMKITRADVIKFLEKCPFGYDLIFADPPYAGADIRGLCEMIFSKNILNPGGMLIFEHIKALPSEHLPFFVEKKIYGDTAISFFENK